MIPYKYKTGSCWVANLFGRWNPAGIKSLLLSQKRNWPNDIFNIFIKGKELRPNVLTLHSSQSAKLTLYYPLPFLIPRSQWNTGMDPQVELALAWNISQDMWNHWLCFQNFLKITKGKISVALARSTQMSSIGPEKEVSLRTWKKPPCRFLEVSKKSL